MLIGWSIEDIAESAGWERKPETFVRAIQSAGFLDGHPGYKDSSSPDDGDLVFSIHDYGDWAPDYVKRRWARQEQLAGGPQRDALSTKELRQFCPDNVQTCPDCDRTCLDHTKQSKAKKPSRVSARASPRGQPRKRDEIWDAVCAEFGFDSTAMPDSVRKRIGKVVRDLKAYKATARDVKTRAGRYRAKWPEMDCTPEALVKHWEVFRNDNKTPSSGGRVAARAGKYSGR